MTMRLISSNLLSSSRNLLGSTSSRIGCGLMPRVLPLVQIPIKFACASSLARSPHVSLEEKAMLVESLLRAKSACGKTYDEIAAELGLTNAYVAQLFLNQAQLKPGRVAALRKAVPALSDTDLEHMQRCPYRSFNETVREEPLVYRLEEAVLHYGEGLKSVVNEKFGDGIMSAIDFYVTVDKIKGSQEEDRVVITFNGKFLPHIEQTAAAAAIKKP